MWKTSDYLLGLEVDPLRPTISAGISERILALAFRTDFSRPGFALLELHTPLTPAQFRAVLIGTVIGLGNGYQIQFGRPLALCSLGRFDQQVSTEAHLDGAPDESILVLGYEPTVVESRIALIDYSKAAADLSLEPKEFLDRFNPTFAEGKELLAPYRTELSSADFLRHNILVVNNSSQSVGEARDSGMLGVMHQSTIPIRRPTEHRFVNRVMMTPNAQSHGCEDLVIHNYVETGAFATCC